MGKKNYYSPLLLVVFGGGLAAGPSVQAKQTGEAVDVAASPIKRYDFNIPGGSSLTDALLVFGRQSRLQLIAPSELTNGLSSAAVIGSYSPEDALRTLLSGTALGFKYVSANTVQIFSTATTSANGTEVLGTVQVAGSADNSAASTLYARIGGHPSVQHAFAGLSAAASAMVIATALKIAAPLLTRPYALVIVAITFVAAAILRLPLLYVVLVCAPLSILLLDRMEK